MMLLQRRNRLYMQNMLYLNFYFDYIHFYLQLFFLFLHIDQEIHMPQPRGKDVDINNKVLMVLFIDLLKCYQNMGHYIDDAKKDSFILHMALNIKLGYDLDTEDDYQAYIMTDSVAFLFKSLLRSFEGWAKSDGKEFLFTRFAKETNIIIFSYQIILLFFSF